ncbi:hypothetical protein AMECASPLE_036539 [Ameca splendens]|uniref:Uncharacterized protein n=1 Tax=Ameca splendens TaxID=208324 RepID=A0ABV0ZGG3_9TELE
MRASLKGGCGAQRGRGSGEFGHTTHSNPSTGTRNSGTQGWKCGYETGPHSGSAKANGSMHILQSFFAALELHVFQHWKKKLLSMKMCVKMLTFSFQ